MSLMMGAAAQVESHQLMKKPRARRVTHGVRACLPVHCNCLIRTGYDPFNEHVADPNEAQLERTIQEVEQGKYHSLKSNLQSGFLCSLVIPESHNHPSDASAAVLRRTEDFPVSFVLWWREGCADGM